ncbi:MAG: PKD domain-containing protein [Candidatus Kapabacteria bacterium]|nr:PKD domain-containing protein [Candidatus Kapabacteria bacterium]MBX7156196.1 PKD domain-containing protein [Bacteroidota bacterium]
MKNLHLQLRVSFVTMMFVALLFVGCPESNNPITPGENKLELGTETQLNQTQQNAGTIITINKPGNPLTGMTITIPTGAYTNARPFTVTSFEIKSHKFGSYVNPITPLIRVSSSGGYANGIYEIKIPITLPQGEIPLVFIYDEQIGKLEPMIVQYYNATSVTVLTRHFATSVIHPQGAAKLIGSKVQGLEEYSSFFVSSLKESLLNAAGTITTGFAVGVDDWEFVNYGSYVAPGGHCAGQSIGAMWYWYEKKSKTGEKLSNKFSNNPSMWEDNTHGYRFCSVLQNDLLPLSLFTSFMRKTVRLDTNLDKIKFLTTAGALYVTHEPLYISIAYQDGVDDNNKPKYAGHAIVCYGVSMNEKKILISDPNTPNNAQSIELINDHFKPYQSKLNGNAASSEFPFITPMAKTSLIEWSKIESRYAELLNGTIGNDKFPAYTTWVKSKNETILSDGYSVDNDTLLLYTDCPTAEWGWNVDGKRRIITSVYNEDGVKVQTDEGSGLYKVILKPGANKLGILIEGKKGTDKIEAFIDFKWITINKVKVQLSPEKLDGVTETEYTWTLDSITNGMKYYIKWNFGDKTTEVRTDNVNKAYHTYRDEGTYQIIATLYTTDNIPVTSDTTTANITLKNSNNVVIPFKYSKVVELAFQGAPPDYVFEYKIPFSISVDGTIEASNLAKSSLHTDSVLRYFGYTSTLPTIYKQNLLLTFSMQNKKGSVEGKYNGNKLIVNWEISDAQSLATLKNDTNKYDDLLRYLKSNQVYTLESPESAHYSNTVRIPSHDTVTNIMNQHSIVSTGKRIWIGLYAKYNIKEKYNYYDANGNLESTKEFTSTYKQPLITTILYFEK